MLNIFEHVKIKNSIKNFSASEHCLISRTWLSAENIPTKHVSMFLSNRCFLRTIMYNNEAVWSIEALTNVRHLVQDIYTDLKTYCRKANQVHRGSIIQLIRVLYTLSKVIVDTKRKGCDFILYNYIMV